MSTGKYERKPSMRTGKNSQQNVVEGLHLVTLTEKDKRYCGKKGGGLVPYLVRPPRMQLFGIYRRQSNGEPARWERHATQFGHDEC